MGVDPSAPGSPVLLRVFSVFERHWASPRYTRFTLAFETRSPRKNAPFNMSDPRPDVKPALAESSTSPDPSVADGKMSDHVIPPLAPPLASGPDQRMEAALGDSILRFLRIRKGPKKDAFDLDAVGD